MKNILAALFFIVIGGSLSMIFAPQLFKDATGSGWRPAPELRAEEYDCRTKSLMFTFCDIDWIGPKDKGTVSFLTLGPVGDFPARFMRAGNGHVSLNYALDHMFSRFAALAAMLLSTGAIVFKALQNLAASPEPAAWPSEKPAPQPRQEHAPVGVQGAARQGFGRRAAPPPGGIRAS